MALPLQPDLQRPLPAWRRWLVPLTCVIAILLLGAANVAQRLPERLIGNDGPRGDRYLTVVGHLIDQASERVWVMLYVARLGDDPDRNDPVRWLCGKLATAHERGLDVRVVLDRSPQKGEWPGPDNSPVADHLRSLGVTVIEDELAIRTHAKVVLADDACLVGSHNWTISALTRNREYSMLSWDPNVVSQVERAFQAIADWSDAAP